MTESMTDITCPACGVRRAYPSEKLTPETTCVECGKPLAPSDESFTVAGDKAKGSLPGQFQVDE